MLLAKSIVTLLVSSLSLAAAAPSERRDAPAPDQVQLKNVPYNGSGCPKDTVTKAFSSIENVITLMYSAYTAQTGPKIDPAKSRAACQLNLIMGIPQGWQ